MEEYLEVLAPLIGDKRTWRTFRGVVQDIIGSEGLVCAKIARFCFLRCGEKGVRQMMLGETTLRSHRKVETIVERMRQRAV
ncbi:MAG: hypothetical protein ACUVT1_00590 [Anaerolineae bacterium]